jgi:hypothetical protein
MEPLLHFPEREGRERGESKTIWEGREKPTNKQ